MPKNPLSDLDEILAKSQRLTARFSDAATSFRYLNRGVSELGEASRLLTESADSRTTDRRVGEDTYSRNIFNEINAITLRTIEEPVQLSGTDLDNYLAHHHDMIVLNAIQEARQTSDTFLHDMQHRWIIDDWEQARSSFFESLGHRANKWGLDGASSGVFEEKPSALSTPLATPGRSGRNGTVGATPSGIGSLVDPLQASRKGKTLTTLPPLLTKYANYVQEVNKTNRKGVQRTAYCESLLKILQDTVGHHFLPSVSTNAPPAVAQEIQELHKILSPQDMTGFRSLLSLLSSMTGESQQETISPGGFFSSLCFDHDKIDPVVLFERKQKLTFGGKNYFEQLAFELYQKQLIEAQRNAGMIDALQNLQWSQRTEGTSLKAFLIQYIKYESKHNYLPSTCQLAPFPVQRTSTSAAAGVINKADGLLSPMESIPYWTLIYHALRIGSFQIAVDVLEYVIEKQNRKMQGEEQLLIVLKYLHYSTLIYQQKLSGNAPQSGGISTPANNRSTNPEMQQWKNELASLQPQLSSALGKIHGFHKDFMNHQTLIQTIGENINSTISEDPYYGLLLNLLGVIDNGEIANSDIKPFIFEDFVWCNLFFIYSKRILLEATESASMENTSSKKGVSTGTPAGYHYPPSPFRPGSSTPHGAEKTSSSTHGNKALSYNGEEEFLELIYSYGGVTYFDPNYSNPYKYALLMFLCHRFGDGILHLYQCDAMKLFPTVHLLVPLLYYGLVLPHVPLLQNPYSSLVMSQFSHSYAGSLDQMTPSSSGHDRHVYTQLLPITILLSYMTLPILQTSAPEIAIDYFFTLQTSWFLYFQPQSDVGSSRPSSSSSSITLHTPYSGSGRAGNNMSSYQNKEFHRMKYEESLWQWLEEYLVNYVSIQSTKEIRDRLLGCMEVPVSRLTTVPLKRKEGKLAEYLSLDNLEDVYNRLIQRYLQLSSSASTTATAMTAVSSSGMLNEPGKKVTSVSISYAEIAFELCLFTGQYSLLCEQLYTQLLQYWLPLNFKELHIPKLNGANVSATAPATGTGIASTLIESQLLIRQYWKEKSEYYLQLFTNVLIPATATGSISSTNGEEYKDYLYAITMLISYYHLIDSIYYHHDFKNAYDIYETIDSFFLQNNNNGTMAEGEDNGVLHWVEPILDDLVMIVATMLVHLVHAQQQQQQGGGMMALQTPIRQYAQEFQEIFDFVQGKRDLLKHKDTVLSYFYALQNYVR